MRAVPGTVCQVLLAASGVARLIVQALRVRRVGAKNVLKLVRAHATEAMRCNSMRRTS